MANGFQRKLEVNLLFFESQVRLDSALEVKYFHNGGILHTFLREMLHQ
jgi:aconitase A